MNIRLLVNSACVASALLIQPALFAGELRNEWKEAKETFQTRFVVEYEDVSEQDKEALGLNKGDKPGKYLKYGAKLGPNLDKLDVALKKHEALVKKYRHMGWTKLTKKHPAAALKLAKLTYLEDEYKMWLKIKDTKPESMNFKKLKALIQSTYDGKSINFKADAVEIWKACASKCENEGDTSISKLQYALKEAKKGMDEMITKGWTPNSGYTNYYSKLGILDKTKTKVNKAVDKVKESCEKYNTRINVAEAQIKHTEILAALEVLQGNIVSIYKAVDKKSIK